MTCVCWYHQDMYVKLFHEFNESNIIHMVFVCIKQQEMGPIQQLPALVRYHVPEFVPNN